MCLSLGDILFFAGLLHVLFTSSQPFYHGLKVVVEVEEVEEEKEKKNAVHNSHIPLLLCDLNVLRTHCEMRGVEHNVG
jgi:hypothetical protein